MQQVNGQHCPKNHTHVPQPPAQGASHFMVLKRCIKNINYINENLDFIKFKHTQC